MKALIVSDKIMESLGYVGKCVDFLRTENVQSETYTGVNSEPTDLYVEESLALFKETKVAMSLFHSAVEVASIPQKQLLY